jgi:hypothetical protein
MHDQGHSEERYTETALSDDKQRDLTAYLPKRHPLSKSLPNALRAFNPDGVGSRYLSCVRLTFYQTPRGHPTQDGSRLRTIFFCDVTTPTKGTTHQAPQHGVTAQITTPQDFLFAICP